MYNRNNEDLMVDCDVTITITRRLRLAVPDADVSLDKYGDSYSRNVDLTDVDWDDVAEYNDIIPDGWNLDSADITPVQW